MATNFHHRNLVLLLEALKIRTITLPYLLNLVKVENLMTE